MSEQRKQNILNIFDMRKEVFVKKNKDYGDAYILAGKLFEMIFPDGIQLKTWNDHCAYQVMTRKMDKIARFCNLRFTDKKKAEVAESIADTLGDDGIYSFMLEELEKSSHVTETKEVDSEKICDECGHIPAIGNVRYEDNGSRPLCKACNKNAAQIFDHLMRCRCPKCVEKRSKRLEAGGRSPIEEFDVPQDPPSIILKEGEEIGKDQ